MTAAALPFTHEMVVVHKYFRREFAQGPSWVRRVPAGDTKQAQVVSTHLKKGFELLHHHHEGEDLNLWPLLRLRAADHAALLDDMEAQHRGIDPALELAEAAGASWAASADPEHREAFAAAIEGFCTSLVAHLDQEESDILPLAQEHLSEEEWSMLAKHAIATTPKADLVKGLGGILEDATPDERAMMLAVIPTVPKLLYNAFGKRAYVKEATAVRGVAPVGL